MNEISELFEKLIKDIQYLRARLTVEGNVTASQSLFTVEEDLIWQLYELTKFEETQA